jgi:diadenosine tetraphosphate (Ap4A) HIT family hydrolase
MNMTAPDRSNAAIAYKNNYYRIEHCSDCFIAGHLIVLPQQPVLSITELSAIALQTLGTTLALAHKVIDAIIQPARIYTLSFSEVMPTIHFHLFPRTEALLQQFNMEHKIPSAVGNGPQLFEWARKRYQDQINDKYHRQIAQINAKFLELG